MMRDYTMEHEIEGYYYDGEKTWIIYKDRDGNITYKEWKDE